MDALAQLALMTKAKLLFERPDTFLSFPALTPISHPAADWNFSNASTASQWQAFADFSQWTNALPQGTIFQPSLDALLWNTYLGVLQNAQVAHGSLTPDQVAQLSAAQNYVSQQGADGLLTNTPVMTAYRQYQQAYFAATEDYNNQKVTATSSADPNALSAWNNGGQAAAQTEVTAAESDWETKGYKVAVEQALQTITSLSSLSPQVQWAQWTAQCNPTIDFPTNPASGGQFGATLFEPFDIAQAIWPSFSVAGPDIPNLVAQAPAELTNIFGSTSGASVIDSLSFEYCSVAVSRSWFDARVFTSRFWKFSDPTVELSDGNSPPSGEWPAYVTAVVLARNIVITSHTAAPTPQPQPSFPVVLPGILHLEPKPEPRPLPVALQPRAPISPVNVRPIARSLQLPPQRMMIDDSVAIRAAASPSTAAVHAEPAAVVAAPVTANPVKASVIAAPLSPQLRARLSSVNFSAVALHGAASTGNGAAATTTNQSTDTNISILAFICKRLPKCPDPDPSLSWTT